MVTHEILYRDVKILVEGDCTPKEEGDWETPPCGQSFNTINVYCEEQNISAFLEDDLPLIDEIVLDKHYS